MSNLKTVQEAIANKIAEAQKVADQAKHNKLMKLIDNPAFIETKRVTQAKQAELDALNTMITQLTNITPFVAKDKTKFSVSVYPVAQATFGVGIAQILGIVRGIDSAFIDTMEAEYSAITGIPAIELQQASLALGSPAYATKDGMIVATEPGNFNELMPLLQSIAIQLNIYEFDINSVTQDKIELWYLREKQKAVKKLEEQAIASELDDEQFILED